MTSAWSTFCAKGLYEFKGRSEARGSLTREWTVFGGPGSPDGFPSGRLAPVGFLSHPGVAFVLSKSYTRAQDSGAERTAPSTFPELKTEQNKARKLCVSQANRERERERIWGSRNIGIVRPVTPPPHGRAPHVVLWVLGSICLPISTRNLSSIKAALTPTKYPHSILLFTHTITALFKQHCSVL